MLGVSWRPLRGVGTLVLITWLLWGVSLLLRRVPLRGVILLLLGWVRLLLRRVSLLLLWGVSLLLLWGVGLGRRIDWLLWRVALLGGVRRVALLGGVRSVSWKCSGN